jgi:DNA polymerase I-like protein with 3'-5' exonuclease and polymerase domains
MNDETHKIYIFSSNPIYFDNSDYVNIAKENNAKFLKGTKDILVNFLEENDGLQLDTETNITDFYKDRLLYVIQLGDYAGKVQLIFDFPHLPDYAFDILRELFLSDTEFIAHNAKFEYIIIYKYFQVYINNFQDTFLASKLLTAGLDLDPGYNGLKNQLKTRFGIEIPKEDQSTFDGEVITPSQIIYAATDVIYLKFLLDKLLIPIDRWKLNTCYQLERRALRPIGDFTINGVEVDTVALAENTANFITEKKEAMDAMVKLIKGVTNPVEIEKIKQARIIQPYDEVKINWRSSNQKKLILKHLYPDEEINSTAVKALEKLKEKVDKPKYLALMLNKNYEKLEELLVGRHLDFLVSSEMFIKKGSININLDSPAQVLQLFKIWYPQLTGVNAKSIKKLKHPIILAYKKLSKATKAVSSFGDKMFEFIGKDGRIHGNFTQLVPSGSRSSSSKPNLQQMPATEEYRRIIVPRKGWKLVDSDYSSAELFLAAFLSKDTNLLYAVKHGYDLHSYSAYLIFGDSWIEAGGEKEPIGKPKTKEANKLRKTSKSLSFSLLYGTGVVAFSENVGIQQAEGKKLMKRYFDTFPELAAFFKNSGNEALTKGYVREPFFDRVRFFNKPTNGKEASHNKNAGMNYKPQAANGSIMKYAIALMKKYIEDNNLDNKVKLLLFVHDQALTEVREDFIDTWAILQTQLMEKAALKAIPTGELKAESAVLDHWTK